MTQVNNTFNQKQNKKMNSQVIEGNAEIKKVAVWFATVKAPDLKEKIDAGLKEIESGQQLTENYRKLFGFMLFSYAMNHGPHTFFMVERVSEEIHVTEEFKQYANDWNNHSKKPKPINS